MSAKPGIGRGRGKRGPSKERRLLTRNLSGSRKKETTLSASTLNKYDERRGQSPKKFGPYGHGTGFLEDGDADWVTESIVKSRGRIARDSKGRKVATMGYYYQSRRIQSSQ